MNTKRIVSLLLLMLASAFGSQAATIFDVQVDTSTFLGAGLGFNVQLNGGGGSSVLLSDFFFGGGAPLDPPVTFGGASGDLRSSVTLRTAEFFNDFTQPFLAGALLRFRISF
ncbi:MAG TPA: hypothetical protein DEH78_23900, partial [Solibacterales bacterium]|nr:hypothetical protein [Bryobacterales bacterium]